MPESKFRLFERMANLTAPLCASGKDECEKFSGNPHRCCKRKFCKMAEVNIKRSGIEIKPFKKRIMFLGPIGCIVPAYLRPVCALHVCSISWAAESHIEHDPGKTKQYFDLRRLIES